MAARGRARPRRAGPLAALLLLLAATASAGEPTAAQKDTARSMMDAGDRAYQAREYGAALESYKAAHAIMGIPNTGIWVAKTQVALGQLVEARDTALAVARMPAQPGEHPIATRSRAEAEELAKTLVGRIPAITVTVEGGGTAVSVELDGAQVPREALVAPLKVNPGKHTAKASAPGHRDAVGEVGVEEGQTATLQLRLVPTETTASPPARTTAAPAAPAVQPDTGFKMSPLVYVGLGLGAAGLAVGGITGILALSKAAEAKESCTDNVCEPEAQDPIDSSDTFANVANVGFGVGVLGFGLGVLGLVLANKARDTNTGSAPARVVPFIGIGTVGVRGAL